MDRRWTALCAAGLLCAACRAEGPDAREASGLPAAGWGVAARGSPVGGQAASPLDHVPGELLVRFHPAARPEERAQAAARAGGRLVREYRSVPGLALVRAADAPASRRALARIRQDPAVEYAEPSYRVRALRIPDDPLFGEQWGLDDTLPLDPPGVDARAASAWDLTTGSRDVVVAVVDLGVDFTHPDLAANVWRNAADCDGDGVDDDQDGYVDDCHGIDAAAGTGDPMDDDGHGTHVAGTIGAVGNNGTGVAGVAWEVTLLPCKFLDAQGEGSTAGAIACLDYVASMKDRGVHVVAINASWGGGLYSQALVDAIEAQRRRGILFVAAAGNDGLDDDLALTYPCSYPSPGIVCVAAHDPQGRLPIFTNRGGRTVDLAAPGTNVLSTYPGGYATASGTSMAAPHVSGAIALLAAYHPAEDWRALRSRLLASGAPLDEVQAARTVTGRRLDLRAALDCQDRTVLARLAPFNTRDVSLAQGVELRALHVTCAQPAGDVPVAVEQGGLPTGEVVVLRDDGSGPDAVAGDGEYAAAWRPTAAGLYDLVFPGGDRVTVNADAELEPGFPAKTWHGPGSYDVGPQNAVLVGDIDGQGGPEVLVSGIAAGPLYAFAADGRAVPGWPVLEGGVGVANAALGHLSPTLPGQQVVVGYAGRNGAAYGGDGALLPGWPFQADYGLHASPVTLDVDGDGLDEALMEVLLRGDGTRQVWRTQGTTTNAVTDLDGDGEVELVSTSNPSHLELTLRVSRLDETTLEGFPVVLGPPAYLNAFPAVGDVDGDGEPEIVLQPSSEVVVVSRRGQVERRIPLAGTFSYVSAVALADLDGDGVLDILAQGDGALNAVRGDGSALSGWPVGNVGGPDGLLYAGNSSPVVGDLDGDGHPEVAVLSTPLMGTGLVHVFRWDGTPVPHFPKRLDVGAGMTPAIADVDGDGRNELIVANNAWGGVEGYFDRLWVFDLGGAADGTAPWGQFQGNAQRTGTPLPVPAARRAFRRLGLTTSGPGLVESSPFGLSCGALCSRAFPEGTRVTLTATPDPGRELRAWTGACSGRSASCEVLLDADRAVGAEFGVPQRVLTVARTGGGSGSVRSSPAGIDCGSTCTATYVRDDGVTLTATAAPGSSFAGWQGACTGESPSCTVAMGEDRAVVAAFRLDSVALTVTRSGLGAGTVTSSPAGIACGSTCSGRFSAGVPVTLTAAAAEGSTFSGWTGACAGQPAACSLPATSDAQAGAVFDRSGGGGGGGGGCQAGGGASAWALLALAPLALACGAHRRARRRAATSG